MSYESVTPKGSPNNENTDTIALVLEIVLGFFGFLGIGHIYTGRLGLGIGLLIGWWVYMFFVVVVSAITGGIAACLFIPVNLGLLAFSGIKARNYARTYDVDGKWGPAAAITAVGCLLILVIVPVITIAILTLLGPQIGSVFSDITSGLSTPIP